MSRSPSEADDRVRHLDAAIEHEPRGEDLVAQVSGVLATVEEFRGARRPVGGTTTARCSTKAATGSPGSSPDAYWVGDEHARTLSSGSSGACASEGAHKCRFGASSGLDDDRLAGRHGRRRTDAAGEIAEDAIRFAGELDRRRDALGVGTEESQLEGDHRLETRHAEAEPGDVARKALGLVGSEELGRPRAEESLMNGANTFFAHG
jgi:hypothetical protein